MKKVDIKQIINDFVKSRFFFESGIPLGYVAGLPAFKTLNGQPCIVVPFLKYKITGEVDKTLVYPIRYSVTISLITKSVLKFEDLSYNRIFRKVDFNSPIGFFRHEAVKHFSKAEFTAKKDELFEMYNEIANAALNKSACSVKTKKAFSELLGIILEPCLKPIYKALDGNFYKNYLA